MSLNKSRESNLGPLGANPLCYVAPQSSCINDNENVVYEAVEGLCDESLRTRVSKLLFNESLQMHEINALLGDEREDKATLLAGLYNSFRGPILKNNDPKHILVLIFITRLCFLGYPADLKRTLFEG